MLALAQMGLKDLIESNDVQRQVAGIYHVCTYGRAVTNVLAHIRTFDRDGFDAWWQPRERAMRADPLCRYFYEMRTVTLKDGPTPVMQRQRVSVHEHSSLIRNTVVGFDSADLSNVVEPLGSTAPFPNSSIVNYGDYFKSSHVETQLPDGSRERSYVALPRTLGAKQFLLPNAPAEHLGQSILDGTAQGLCTLYVQYLGNLVRDAIAHFSPASSSSST